MRVLALIPARGGSKRLPGKNIKILGDKPLIAWTIIAAKSSGICSHIWVSTDDLDIAKVAKTWGAEVPFIREPSLASDTASSVDVALDALGRYERIYGTPDGLLLLQPTSPFRSGDSLRRAINVFKENHCISPVVGVSPAPFHPAWCFHPIDGKLKPFLGWAAARSRLQDLPTAYALNGSIYLISPNQLKKDRSFLSDYTIPIISSDLHEAIDIDTENDWVMAESMLSKYNNK